MDLKHASEPQKLFSNTSCIEQMINKSYTLIHHETPVLWWQWYPLDEMFWKPTEISYMFEQVCKNKNQT